MANQIDARKAKCGKNKYKGVYKKRDRWQVKINIDGKDYTKGCYKDEVTAAHHYDYYMLQHYGNNNCYLNFPQFNYNEFKPKTKPTKRQTKKQLGITTASEIRHLYRYDGWSIKELAQKFNVTIMSIYNIINNVTYHDPNYRRFGDVKLGGGAIIDVKKY